jgi:hypothetical protein
VANISLAPFLAISVNKSRVVFASGFLNSITLSSFTVVSPFIDEQFALNNQLRYTATPKPISLAQAAKHNF